MDVLLTYDIETTTRAGARRLARVAKVCEGFGVRVQFSVFECRLSAASLVRLTGQLTEIIDNETDSVHLYRFDGPLADARTSLGRPPHRDPGQHWLL
jgi:CRISPR-associated protein Cas2